MPRRSRPQRPSILWFVVLDGSLAILALVVLLPALAARIRSRFPLPSDRWLKAILLGALLVHLGEGSVAWRQASAKGLPAAAWAAQTTLVGFPSLIELSKIQPEPES